MGEASVMRRANPQAGWEAAGAAFARAHDHIPLRLSARCERRDGGVGGRGHSWPASHHLRNGWDVRPAHDASVSSIVPKERFGDFMRHVAAVHRREEILDRLPH